MTLTLKYAITSTQTTIDVNGADTLRVGSYRQLEDEVLLIRAADAGTLQPGETPWQRLSVDRGIENSERVEHAAGVTMATYSGGAGGGAIAGTAYLIGPFNVPFDDPGVNNTFTVLDDLAAGTIVWRVAGFANGVTATPGNIEITVDAQDSGASTLLEVLRVNVADFSTPDLELYEAGVSFNDWVPKARVVRVPDAAGWQLASYIFVGGGGELTAGSFDFYALISEPA